MAVQCSPVQLVARNFWEMEFCDDELDLCHATAARRRHRRALSLPPMRAFVEEPAADEVGNNTVAAAEVCVSPLCLAMCQRKLSDVSDGDSTTASAEDVPQSEISPSRLASWALSEDGSPRGRTSSWADLSDEDLDCLPSSPSPIVSIAGVSAPSTPPGSFDTSTSKGPPGVFAAMSLFDACLAEEMWMQLAGASSGVFAEGMGQLGPPGVFVAPRSEAAKVDTSMPATPPGVLDAVPCASGPPGVFA